jgi:hypothetical protein
MLKEPKKTIKEGCEATWGYRKRWVTLRGRGWNDSQKPIKMVEELIRIYLQGLEIEGVWKQRVK